MKKILVCGAVVMGLSACGGGGKSYESLLNSLDDRLDRNADIVGTPPEDVPLSGSASFSGEGIYSVTVFGAETGFISEADVDVNFRTDAVTGELTNFYDEFADSYSGTVTIGNGSLDRTGSEVLAVSDLTGTLRGPNGERIVVDGALAAGFGNSDASVLAGFVGGDVTVDGIDGSFEGVIVTEE